MSRSRNRNILADDRKACECKPTWCLSRWSARCTRSVSSGRSIAYAQWLLSDNKIAASVPVVARCVGCRAVYSARHFAIKLTAQYAFIWRVWRGTACRRTPRGYVRTAFTVSRDFWIPLFPRIKGTKVFETGGNKLKTCKNGTFIFSVTFCVFATTCHMCVMRRFLIRDGCHICATFFEEETKVWPVSVFHEDKLIRHCARTESCCSMQSSELYN